jgi:phospholipid transport system substrate-binding protein
MNRTTIANLARARLVLAAWAIALLASMALFGQPALAETPAENYVRANVQRGLGILGNHGIPDAQRRAEFRDFLTSLTDIRRIAMFTMGAARRTASPTDTEAFVNAFRNYAVAVYESRLTAYAGQSLKVTGSTDHAANDYIVSTVLVDPTGKTDSGGGPIEVDFRVLYDNGRYVVIDVSIAGVWLAIEERDQFSSFLEENNDSISALVSHLNALTQRLRGGGANTPVH